MPTYTVECTLHASTSANVELPDGKTWDDVQDWYVKWDCLNVNFKDEDDYVELPLGSDSEGAIDWKRPASVAIFSLYENGETNYDVEVAGC